MFTSNRNVSAGQNRVYQKLADGGAEELLFEHPGGKIANDMSPDGRFLLYHGDADPKLDSAIWAVPMDGDRKPRQLVQAPFEQGAAQFSPDGKWIAYQSNESGRYEIHIQQFPTTAGKWQVSTNGGLQARWRRDGKELFYIAIDGRLMAVPIRFAASGTAVESGTPVPLFATKTGSPVQARPTYVVSTDGQRFLMNILAQETVSPITVIVNWTAALKK